MSEDCRVGFWAAVTGDTQVLPLNIRLDKLSVLQRGLDLDIACKRLHPAFLLHYRYPNLQWRCFAL